MKLLLILFFISCVSITNGMICTDSETGQTYTIFY